ncbi:hypothetical protein MPOCJGCO_3248 [Methylobacterium trifolii]|uniref:Secreted protein n=1 Tax=Methylobacterium trifolii TaxID=1003092 RepID=A0ABQ4U1V1_9HYPH|nr:hypothetical protein MPOCJGCO_3248 [Methylobacterium trifolii]
MLSGPSVPVRSSSPGVGPVGWVGGGGGATSSFWIVPVAVAVVIVPKFGPDRVTEKPSFGSTAVSPATSTVTVWLVTPWAKVSVPDGRALPAKSEAEAGFVPEPVTA